MLNVKSILWVFILLLGFGNSTLASNNGWVSSGGEIFLYSRNPWFVKNVNTVNYCIQIDSATVSASAEDIRNAIHTAVDYWKVEMPTPANASPGMANVATQTFIEQTVCDDVTTDIRFKVGYGTLSANDISGIGDPTAYVGVTIRTDYDLKTLKGKGFVYIASDKGPFAYKNSGELLTEAWKYPKLLQYAFIHEMGHIFGIPHTGTGIMSEIFLNQVLHKRFSSFYLDHPLQPFLQEPRAFEVCAADGSFSASFFMVDPATSCLKLEADDVAGNSWKVSATTSKDTPNYVVVGDVKVNGSSRLDLAAKPAVIVQLPPEQQVFGVQDRFVNSFMIGPLFVNRNAQGFYETATSHKPYPLQIQLSADAVIFTGVTNGRLMPVLTYAPPSLLKMLLPIP